MHARKHRSTLEYASRRSNCDSDWATAALDSRLWFEKRTGLKSPSTLQLESSRASGCRRIISFSSKVGGGSDEHQRPSCTQHAGMMSPLFVKACAVTHSTKESDDAFTSTLEDTPLLTDSQVSNSQAWPNNSQPGGGREDVLTDSGPGHVCAKLLQSRNSPGSRSSLAKNAAFAKPLHRETRSSTPVQRNAVGGCQTPDDPPNKVLLIAC